MKTTEALQYDDLPQKRAYRQSLLDEIKKLDNEIAYTIKYHEK